MVVMRGLKKVIFDLIKAVGRGSSEHVEGLMLCMRVSTCLCVVRMKCDKVGAEVRGMNGMTLLGVRLERMVVIFVVKESRNLLHWSSVLLFCLRVSGLRR